MVGVFFLNNYLEIDHGGDLAVGEVAEAQLCKETVRVVRVEAEVENEERRHHGHACSPHTHSCQQR